MDNKMASGIKQGARDFNSFFFLLFINNKESRVFWGFKQVVYLRSRDVLTLKANRVNKSHSVWLARLASIASVCWIQVLAELGTRNSARNFIVVAIKNEYSPFPCWWQPRCTPIVLCSVANYQREICMLSSWKIYVRTDGIARRPLLFVRNGREQMVGLLSYDVKMFSL